MLGLSAYYHDSAACLVRGGRIVAAAQEERFTRIKNDPAFPKHAVRYCLDEAGITLDQVDLVAFYDKPLLKFDRLIETWLAYAPRGFSEFRHAAPTWLSDKVHLRRELDRALGRRGGRYVFPSHHESHAASAFFPSPFEEAAILTVDGVGEWATATIGIGRGNRIALRKELRFPHSLGLLYSAFTAYCGFHVNSGEYKLMGLAPYGDPTYVETIREHLVDVREDGSIRLGMRHFAFGYSDRMFAPSVDTLLGGPARRPGEPLTQRHMDVARSIQEVTEEVVLKMARHAHAETGARNLVMAGGVALNCVANGRICREGPFERVWVQPAAGDAGGALGAALFVWHQLMRRPRTVQLPDGQSGSLLGPAWSSEYVRAMLGSRGIAHRWFADEGELLDEVARQLDAGRVVGHFAGRMEFGPRALGSRSILADARSSEMQKRLNKAIKFRESFRPFAPSVLEHEASSWFDIPPDRDSPYMLTTTAVLPERCAAAPPSGQGLERLDNVRSEVPAITHVNHSARLQTVDAVRFPRLFALLERFEARTGVPLVVNTSFNLRGEPIVATPEDALRCFQSTNIDSLVLEDVLLEKPQGAPPLEAPDALEPAKRRGSSAPIRLDLDPEPARLRAFGLVGAAVFGLLAVAAACGWSMFADAGPQLRTVAPWVLGTLGGSAALFSALRPRWNRPLWVGLSLITWPVGVVVSWVLVGLLFFGLLTPMALVMRVFGRDALRLHSGSCDTMWTEAAGDRADETYFRQY